MSNNSGLYVVMFAVCVIAMVAVFYMAPVLAVFSQIAGVLGGL